MIVFIVPIKSKLISKSWSLLSILFERCIRSICNQTDDNFRVVVVCNEKPDIDFFSPNIHYVEVDFLPPISNEFQKKTLEGYAYGLSQDIANKNADKARKILKGIEYAQQFSPQHLMVVDADDCVSRHLAKFVNQHSNCDGWVMKKGYIYYEGSRWLLQNATNFNQVSGTSVIIKNSLYSVLFENRDFYYHSFDQIPAVDIKPLPFIGTVYSMANGENIYMTQQTFSEITSENIWSGLITLVQKITKYRLGLMTSNVRQEFGVYSIAKDMP
jgi:hypothetical protein